MGYNRLSQRAALGLTGGHLTGAHVLAGLSSEDSDGGSPGDNTFGGTWPERVTCGRLGEGVQEAPACGAEATT